jgi:Putative addiction module component
MAITLPIKRMSREDKRRAMEALWADLSQDESDIDSPDWHAAAHRETERLVRDGKAVFSGLASSETPTSTKSRAERMTQSWILRRNDFGILGL